MRKRLFLNGLEQTETRRIIQEKTGYFFRNKILLNQVFKRSSFAAEMGESSNEIFEFYGDQVISYYVVKYVSKRCGSMGLMDEYTCRIRENKFTLIKQGLVNNESLAKIIDEWGIAQYLLLGTCDIKNEVFKQTKVKADLFESVIGAIAVETSWNEEILESVVSRALNLEERITEMIESDTKVSCFDLNNAISVLKEIAERGGCTMPQYNFTGPEYIGYDEEGNPKWGCCCSIINDKLGLSKLVYASSKKDAKKAAAYLILCEHLCMQNKYGPNSDGYMRTWSYKNGKLTPND